MTIEIVIKKLAFLVDIINSSPFRGYVYFFLVLFLSILLSRLIELIFKRYIRSLTKKTSTDFDDAIIDIIEKPFLFIMFVLFFRFGLNYLFKKSSILILLNRVIFVLIVLVSAYLLSKLSTTLINKVFHVKRKFKKTPQLINKIIVVVVYLLAILLLLDYFGIKITPLIATLGVGGLAVGLALQDTLSNLFAGLYVLSNKPVHIGDFIELSNGISGYVEDIGWREIKIKTWDNNIIFIPNSKLIGGMIHNTSMPETPILFTVECGVGYNEDLEKVEKVVLDVAKKIQKKVEGAVEDHKPAMRYYEFGDSNINFKVILKSKTRGDKFLIKHEFIKALKKRFDKEKIEISWPVVDVHFKNKQQN